MIVFKKVRFKNFLSFGNKFTEIQLNRSPVTLMTGQNGSGKSTMIDAVYFALYGKAYRKIKKDQIINSINRKNLVVELEFSIGNNEYKIVRGIKPNVFDIYVNGVKRENDASLKDNQAWLENNVLKMNSTTMRQIVFLGSTSFVPFMRLPAAERRNVVEEVLDIKIFSVMSQLVKQKISVLSQRYSDFTHNIKLLANEIDLKETHIEEISSRDKTFRDDIQSKISEVESFVSETKEKISAVDAEVAVLEQKIADEEIVSGKLNEMNGIVAKLEGRLSRLKKAVAFYSDNSVCPTCKRDILDEDKEHHLEHYNQQLIEAKETLDKAIDYKSNLEQRMAEIEETKKAISDLLLKKHGYESSIQSSKKRLDDLNRQLNEIDSRSAETEEKLKIELKELKSKHAELVENLEQIANLVQYYKTIATLLKDDGIKAKIIETYLPTINSLIRKYLEILEFACDFSFDEEFNEIIKSRYRDEFSYGNFSEGQKMRIDLALLFTWRELAKLKNSASTNLLVLDEIGSSSLDSDGTDAFLRIVNECDEGNNVFIISHDKSVIDRGEFDMLEFSIRNNFSAVNCSFD